jgi:DNA-binding CsgD family transcriptional regulator
VTLGSPSEALVGRDDEVRRLRRLVAEVAAGRGRSVWVEGEPGVGKSALLAAGLAEAEASGCRLFREAADRARSRFPLWVLLDCLRVGRGAADALRQEIAGLLRGEGSGEVVTPADVSTVVAERLLVLVDRLCAESPVVLVVDDLQWADEASLRVWQRLARLVDQLPLLLVAACRPVPVRAEAAAARAASGAKESVVIELGPLPPDRVVELVERLVGAPPGPRLRSLVGRAGGNPLYVRELVDALVREQRVRVRAGVVELIDGVATPRSLAGAIAERLRFLSERAAGVLRFAALLGSEFHIAELAVLTGDSAAELAGVLDEAVAAGVLAGSGDRRLFRHGLIHQALYERMPVALRVALHRHAAQALAAAGAPAERVAEHLMAAPGSVDAWTVRWVAGAAQGLIYRAPQIAVELLDRVREATGTVAGAPDPVREQMDVSLVTALFLLGRYEQVQRLAHPVLATAGDPAVAGRMAWTLGYALMRGNELEQALAVTSQALVGRTLTPVWTARVRALHAMVLSSLGRHAEAAQAARQAEAEGDQAGDRVAVGYALHARSLIHIWLERDDDACLEAIDRALAVIGDHPETTDLRLMLLGNRMPALGFQGRLAEADQTIEEALALAERAGTPVQLARFQLGVADYCFTVGRWDDALTELAAVAATAALRSDPPRQLYMHGVAALIAAHRDDRTALEEHLRAIDELKVTGVDGHHGMELPRLARAVAAERDGRPEQALAALLSVIDPMSAPDIATDLPEISDMVLPDLVRLLLDAGDEVAARAATELCEADARQTPVFAKQAAAAHCRGLLDADPAGLLAVAEEYHRISFPLYRALSLENAAVLLARDGETRTARAAHADAITIYDRLDAAWDIRRADTRLRALGIRRGPRGPRRRPATGWDALTPVELTIAAQVAQGRSNPDIAADLFLSRRTVQSHISHVLTKLDAHSRVDIARAYTDRQRVAG